MKFTFAKLKEEESKKQLQLVFVLNFDYLYASKI
jgi:hypothetical protein